MRAGILHINYSTIKERGYSIVRFVTQCMHPCMAMYDSVHTAMHGDPALSAIDSEILHGSRLAGATLTSQLQQGSVQSNEERGEEQRVPLHHFPAKFPRVVNK